MLTVLRRQDVDTERRYQAASELMNLNNHRVNRLLAALLDPEADPTTQNVIVQAIAARSQPPDEVFAWPLYSLLSRSDDTIAHELSTALGRYDDAKLIRKLMGLAKDRWAPAGRRRAAIMALGHQHSQLVAETLVELTQTDQPTPVSDAAYEALTDLTKIDSRDRQQWQPWWTHHHRLPQRLWYEALIDNVVRHNAGLAGKSQKLIVALSEAQRQLYRTLPQDDRPMLLLAMLNDALPAARQLAVDLCVQRLIDNQIIGKQLRQALVGRLRDPVVTIRQRAVTLLKDLADEEAADEVARHVVSGHETSPQVLRACLSMMARLPRSQVVNHALKWLSDPWLGADAASVLAVSVDAGLLDADQTGQAAACVRELVRDKPVPDPQYVQLLGRVGNDDDWEKIALWIDSNDEAVKQTAAQVWADSHRPLLLLVKHAGDPVIQQIVIAAARRRGFRPQTLRALIEHKPEQQQVEQAWRLAVVAVAGRVPPADVLRADTQLARLEESVDLRRDVLSAAIDRLAATGDTKGTGQHEGQGTNGNNTEAPQDVGVLVDLLLARAQVCLSDGDPLRATADYQQLEAFAPSMDTGQLAQYRLGMLEVKLAEGEFNEALVLATQVLQSVLAYRDGAAVGNQIAVLFLKAAKRQTLAQTATPDQIGKTVQALTKLRPLLTPSVSKHTLDPIDQLLGQLRQRLDQTSTTKNKPQPKPRPANLPTPPHP